MVRDDKRGGLMKDQKFAWELFKNTGNIDAYLIMKDVEYMSTHLNEDEEELERISNGGYKGFYLKDIKAINKDEIDSFIYEKDTGICRGRN